MPRNQSTELKRLRIKARHKTENQLHEKRQHFIKMETQKHERFKYGRISTSTWTLAINFGE